MFFAFFSLSKGRGTWVGPKMTPFFDPFLDHFWTIFSHFFQKWEKTHSGSHPTFENRKSLEKRGFSTNDQKWVKKVSFFKVRKTRFFAFFCKNGFCGHFLKKPKKTWPGNLKFQEDSKPEKKGSKKGQKRHFFSVFWTHFLRGPRIRLGRFSDDLVSGPSKNQKIRVFH